MSNNFRPRNFNDVLGQPEIKDYLKIKVNAFKKTGKCPDHMLFLGFSGAGKTTLANVVANELDTRFHNVMATNIRTWDDLYNVFNNVEQNDVVFLDEIHALNPKIQEYLYSIMEDFKATHFNKSLKKAQTFTIPRFTLIGATTHSGDLNLPLLSRFPYKAQLQPYSHRDLTKMVISAGERIYNITIPINIAEKIAALSKNTARNAYNLLSSLIVVAEAKHPTKLTSNMITSELLQEMLKHENIDPLIGLDYVSRRYLKQLIEESKIAPVGLKTLASMCREQESNIVNLIEPPLVASVPFKIAMDNARIYDYDGPLVKITKNGRMATKNAVDYMKFCQRLQQSQGWFPNEQLSI